MAKMVLNVAIVPPGYEYQKYLETPDGKTKRLQRLLTICDVGDVIEVNDEYFSQLRLHGITLPRNCSTAEEYIILLQMNKVASRTADTTPVTKFPEYGEVRDAGRQPQPAIVSPDTDADGQ